MLLLTFFRHQMAAPNAWSIFNRVSAGVRGSAQTPPRLCAGLSAMLRLWRQRQRQRCELVLLCDLGLQDTGLSRDLIAHEARKWPWQKWHPQLQQFDITARAQHSPTGIEQGRNRWASTNGAS
jgi:uncharacterized protein YjiS (DUF1127 family)